MANNIILQPASGNILTLTQCANAITAFPNAPVGSTVYTGTITGGANNALNNKAFTIAGFTNANNNGSFICLASTTTTLTLNNRFGVAQTAPATASYSTQGFPIEYATKISNIICNQQGDSINVTTATGDTLVAIAIGLKSLSPFDQLHGTAPYGPEAGSSPVAYTTPFGFTQGLNDFMPSSPIITDTGSTTSAAVTAVSISSNILPVTTSLTVSAGSQITLSGMYEPFLNGVTLTVLGTGSGNFTADFTYTGSYTNNAEPSSPPALATKDGQTWVLAGNLNIADSDYTVVNTPPPFPGGTGGGYNAVSQPYPSSTWNLDGYYPSVYVWVLSSAVAGTYKVTLNSMYQGGTFAPLGLAAGKPIFDGGVNFQIIRFSGAGAVESGSFSIGETSFNPAASPVTQTTSAANGDALISVGLMKSGNAFAPGTVGTLAGSPPTYTGGASMTMISSGKLVGSSAHYIVQYGFTASGSAGTFNPNFLNPLGYKMIVASFGIKSS